MTEAAHDHDVFAAEANDRRELAHAIVHGSRVADRLRAEEVGVEGRDRVCHVASEVG